MNSAWMRILYFIVPMIIAVFLVPPVKKAAWKYGIFAVENERTVHHGKIPRIGGVAVYTAFMIGCLLFVRPLDQSVRAILLGGTIVFAGGLLDDVVNLRPRYKLLFQIAGALAVMYLGNVEWQDINLFFGIRIPAGILTLAITFVWLIGITNAINLLDGMDGLSSGFSIIVLFSICMISTVVNRPEIIRFALILAGAAAGFLVFNFHPASIFIGDCGAQFLGFMIASISIQGFKSGTFITMLMPITLLFIPIMDTLSAMLRRKLSGHKISDADQGHIHHVLMKGFGLGQMQTVLLIYAMTAMFGVTAYICAINTGLGLVILLVLVLLSELLIEVTGMISDRYHPLLSVVKKVFILIRSRSDAHEPKEVKSPEPSPEEKKPEENTPEETAPETEEPKGENNDA